MAFCNHSVYGDASAGFDNNDITGNDVFRRDRLFLSVAENHGGFGGKIHKLAEGIGGLGFGAGFQVLSYGNQCEDHSAGFEIEFMGILMDDVHIAVSEAIGHFIHGKYAV